LEEPSQGTVEIDGVDVRDVDLQDLRRNIAMVNPNTELIDGTVEENIVLGRNYLTQDDLRVAYATSGLTEMLRDLSQGTRTPVVSGGANLSRGMAQRILIARAIVDRPRLLILDEGLAGVEERLASEILGRLCDACHGWTVLDISHEPDVVARATRVHVIGEGRILESGSPADLALSGGAFAALFPYLAAPRPTATGGSSR
jgi:ATP-binding cassette subfamily B protein